MSGYLGGGGGGGVLPADLYQDWAIITISGADWVNNTTGSWLTPPTLTYTTTAKSNSFSYGTSSALTLPATGRWRIHIRPTILNGASDLAYGLQINSVPISFGVATGGQNSRQGNDTLIHQGSAGHQIMPTMFLINGSATWAFTSGFTIYLELLKPAV